MSDGIHTTAAKETWGRRGEERERPAVKLAVADVRVTGNRLASAVVSAATKLVSCVARDHRDTIELSPAARGLMAVPLN